MNEPPFDGFAVEQLIQGFRSPVLPQRKPDQATIEAAERNVRQWTSNVTGILKPGSDAHRREMCRMFRETFSPYRPSVLDWPQLEPDALERIVSLPIWDIAVQTEGRARLRMAAYAGTINEPDVRDALALNAWEENRHTFEPVMQEECRHILLFANWAAWHRAKLSWWRRIRFELKVAAVWTFLGWERMNLARTLDAEGNEHKQDNNFTANGAQSLSSVQIGVRELMELCLAENERRFSGYDRRLLRPETMPKLIGFALRFMRAGKSK